MIAGASHPSIVYPLVIERLPFAKYRELPGEHATALKRALVSPLEYDYYKRNERDDSDSLRIGRAVHTAVLEPMQFLREYVLYDGRRAGKAWEEFEALNAGKTILKPEQYDPACAMAEAVRSHAEAGALVSGPGRNELTIQWRHASGALCKSRIDRLCSAVVDIKTAADITPRAFEAAAYRFGYHVQAAFYRDSVAAAGLGELPFVLVVVQKKPPHDVVVYEYDAVEIQRGREDYERALELVAECRKTGVWPGAAPKGRVPLHLPGWALPEFDEDELTFEGETL